jgi:hypothetical protein
MYVMGRDAVTHISFQNMQLFPLFLLAVLTGAAPNKRLSKDQLVDGKPCSGMESQCYEPDTSNRMFLCLLGKKGGTLMETTCADGQVCKETKGQAKCESKGFLSKWFG